MMPFSLALNVVCCVLNAWIYSLDHHAFNGWVALGNGAVALFVLMVMLVVDE